MSFSLCRISRLPRARAGAQITFLSVAVSVWCLSSWVYLTTITGPSVHLPSVWVGFGKPLKRVRFRKPEGACPGHMSLLPHLLKPCPCCLDQFGLTWTLIKPPTFTSLWPQTPSTTKWASGEAPRMWLCSLGMETISPKHHVYIWIVERLLYPFSR